MARGGKGKSSEKKPEGTDPSAGRDAAPSSAQGAGKGASKKEARIEKARRKELKRLEIRLTAAAKVEAKRVRKLEKARWLRQKLQAAVVESNSKKAPKLPAAEPKRPKQPPAAKASKSPAAKTPRQKPPKPAAPSAPSSASSGLAPTTAAPAPGPAGTPAAPQPAAGVTVVEAYCLREKKRVVMLDPKPVVTANGGAALSGTCPNCGAALYKLVGRKR